MTTVLLVCALLTPMQQAVQFSNWRFQISPFWLQSNQGSNLILTPYERARARNSRAEIRPGVKPNQPLDAWFSAEWTRILAGRTPTKDWGRRATVWPRGIAGLQQQADFKEPDGNVRSVKLIALNPLGSINSVLYTADDAVSAAVSLGPLDGIVGTARFEGPPTAADTTPPADSVKPAEKPTDNRKPPMNPPPHGNTPPEVGPAGFTPTPTPGLGSPSSFGPDPADQIHWNGPEVMSRSALDIKVVTYEGLKQFMALSCSGLHSSVQPRELTYEQAMTSVRRLFAAPNSAKMLNAIRTGRMSSGELQAAAFTGALADNYGYMLGCLLICVEKKPGDPTALFNLAGALAQAGKPNEALAVLQKLSALGKLPVIAFGYDAEASILYIRGYALMLIGKLAKSRAALESAIAKAPSLSEAQYTLAIVLQALGKNYRKPLISGVWRNNRTPMYCAGAFEGDPLTEDKPANIGMPIDELLDLSRGKDRSLPSVFHPTTVEQYKALVDRLSEESKKYYDDKGGLSKQAGEVYHKAVHTPHTMRHLIDARICDIIPPALAQLVPVQILNKEVHDRHREYLDARGRISTHHFKQFAALRNSGLKIGSEAYKQREREICHQSMNSVRPFAQALDLAYRRRFKAWYKYATALGALITDPDWKRYAAIKIREYALSAWWDVKLNAVLSYGLASSCDPKSNRDVPSDNELESDELGECSENAKNRNLEWKVIDDLHVPGASKALPISITAKLNCDEAIVEVEGKIHALSVPGVLETSGSAEVGKNRKGDITIFLGPKVTVGNPIITTGGNAKGGAYVTISHGKVVDVGIKQETYVTQGVPAGAGRVDRTLRVSHGHISFFPAPPPPSKYGLSLYPNK